jgi:single-strand DNA-binding protein
MNAVTMIGRLTEDPNLKHAEGRAICEMRLAVDNGRHPTTFIDVVVFDGQAYSCAEYLAKGRLIAVGGRLALAEWHDTTGRRRQRYSVIGKVKFLDRPPTPVRDEEPIGPSAEDPGDEGARQHELALAS